MRLLATPSQSDNVENFEGNFPTSSPGTLIAPLKTQSDYPNEANARSTKSLLKVIGDVRTELEMGLGGSYYDAAEARECPTLQDSRLADLQSTKRDFGTQLRKCMSRRSIALDYQDWELRQYKTSRIADLIQNTSAVASYNGHIEEFAQLFENPNQARNAVKIGIRFLIVEGLLDAPGSSVILCSNTHLFRSVPFTSLDYLARSIQDTQWIQALVMKHSFWFLQLQQFYNSNIRRVRDDDTTKNHVPSKRSITSAAKGSKRSRLNQDGQIGAYSPNMVDDLQYSQGAHRARKTIR